jgi:hypothetical protein
VRTGGSQLSTLCDRGPDVWLRRGIGSLLILVGAIWILQGMDVLGGSGMSGEAIWAVIGVVVVFLGVIVFITGSRSQGES